MGFQKPSTTRLPQALRDELDAQNGAGDSIARGGRRRNTGSRDRKAERKAERQQMKQRKAQFFSHNAWEATNKRSVDADTNNHEGPSRKKPKLQSTSEVSRTAARSEKENQSKKGKEKEYPKVRKDKEAVAGRKLKTGSAASDRSANMDIDWVMKEKRSKREEDEDAYTSMLEKQLGVNKKKKGKSRYGAGFEDDGLLDLLLDLDEKVLGDADSNGDLEGQLEESEDEGNGSEIDVSEASDSGYDSSSGEGEEEWTGFVSEGEGDDGSDVEETTGGAGNEEAAAGPSSGSKYIPPHLRKQLAAQKEDTSEVDGKLARLLKGLLNRLSEQNIDSILKEIEGLYRSHRRHDITATLTNLIIEGTCSHSSLLDAYVALHAGLVACLHKIIGVELAAYFVQSIVASFERHYAKSTEAPNTEEGPNTKDEELGKECSNLLIFLSDLYNYHVISCTLMYDIIRLILEGDLSELDVELVLKLARGSGAQLRQDDPSALKDIIQIVQTKIGDQRNSSSRTRFMVETLNNLKNNKVKKNAAGAQGGGESKERITKFVNGIDKKYHVHTHEPLRISLEDLHQADSKGKWWLVGAAWGGDPLVDQQSSRAISANQTPMDSENALLKLARKQGMNTDVRRSVFVVLMSSDDYVDACDRLAQLNLTEIQQREIVRVLLHCCGNEKSYNPYYTLIAQHLCRQAHSHRVTLQYCFWDFLRTLGETNVGGADMARNNEDGDDDQGFDIDRVSSTRMANVARAYAWWAAKDCLAITILKTLDFIALKNKTKTFLKHFFTQLFSSTQDLSLVPSLGIDVSVLGRRDDKALADVFVKAKRLPELSAGIVHFLSSNFREGDSQDQNMDAFMQWACDAATDVLQNSFGGGDL